jgi:hypothetical protein
LPILHAQGIHINDTVLMPAQDMVELLVQPVHFVLVGSPLLLNILKLVYGGLKVMLQRLDLKVKGTPSPRWSSDTAFLQCLHWLADP